MKSLDQYIHDNKQMFEEEPETGHFERLQQKMNRTHRQIKWVRWSTGIAASIVFLFSAGILWQYTHRQDNVIVVCENSENMKSCYLDKMNVVAGQINELTKNFDPWDRQQLMDDVQGVIDATSDGLEQEIPEELSDEAAKSILSDYYEYNLERLYSLAQSLEEIQ